ncbi:ankyrin repeat domain-containing protein [Ammoniphilus resinae]|uniref:Ankyrin repeat protein n=1 Tax=Ammoniphilus resinae TaxID=861532 RepID=A0ABS4GNK2_9BACL|nr:ankyrin repeat domain-containing protein [Ammoniphilus resinae]MBP1931824.1 ankyrin repeat protein [Ammoniphilus resinae]
MSLLTKRYSTIISLIFIVVFIVIAYFSYDQNKSEEVIEDQMELNHSLDIHGTTYLMKMAQEGDLVRVKEALKRDANPHATDKYNQTALSHAVSWNQPEVVKTLLEAGANPDIVRHDGFTPLMIAILENKADIANLLLNGGANIHIQDNDANDALQHAVSRYLHGFPSPEIVQKLIELGADVNRANNYGQTPLLHAMEDKNTEMIELLKEHGAVVPKDSKIKLVHNPIKK